MNLAQRKWTMAHGHLLGMGGITTIDPASEDSDSENPEGQVLTPEQYTRLTSGAQGITKVTFSDIKDRSKGDSLSKGIAILQTTWFILQCVARREQGLALTELELVTLALASLNATTYVFWWHNPLGVQEPVRIYYKPEANAEERRIATLDDASDGSPDAEVSAADITSRVGEIFQEFATNVRKFRAKLVPWLLFSASSRPLSLFHVLLLLLISVFPSF